MSFNQWKQDQITDPANSDSVPKLQPLTFSLFSRRQGDRIGPIGHVPGQGCCA